MLKSLVLASLFVTSIAQAKPTAYCNPERSKPCGKSCISLDKTCRKPWTTAVSGIRPMTEKPGFDNPKFIEKAPETK